MNWRPVRSIRGAVLSCVLLSAALPAFTQTSTTGSIRGTVTDPQGGLIPNAIVTVKSEGTDATRTVTTDKGGQYTVGLLPPGTYKTSFTAPGFKTEVPSAITVVVTETARLDVKLVLGSTTDTVEVSGAAPALQVENSTLGTVVDGGVIRELPLTSRNYTQVLTLSAGITSDLNNAATLGKGSPDVYTNGASSISNNFHMDGADINNWASGRAGDFVQQAGIPVPSPDALQEFKIQTTNYDAGFGRDAGANVDVVTKTGTNQLHGAIWEFFRNDIFNANDTFLKIAGRPRPAMKQNQFGATLGGPIIKDKLFFFGTYQGTRQVNGLSAGSLQTVSLFPITDNRSAAAIGAIGCPAGAGSSALAMSRWHPYNGGQYDSKPQTDVACDGSNINPVALNLLNQKLPNGTYLIPTPQRYTTDANGNPIGSSTFSIPAIANEDQYMINTDYIISPKNTLSERYFLGVNPENQPLATAGNPPGNGVSTDFRSQLAVMKLTSAINDHFLNEALAGYIRSSGHLQTQSTITASQIGMTAPSDPTYPLYPVTSVTGYFSLGGGGNDESSSVVNTFEIADQISYTHGKQSFRAGFIGEKNQFDFNDPEQKRGSLGFTTMQDFLLGMSAAQNNSAYSNVNSAGSQQGSYYKGYRGTDMGMFIQDDIKLSQTLTVNAGVRWEIDSGVSFGHGEESSFWPSLVTPFAPLPVTGTLSGYIVPNNYELPVPAGVTKIGDRSLQANDLPLHNFGPRVGFAWQPFGTKAQTVIRGGVGIFYSLPNANSVLQTLGGQPFVSSASLSNAVDQTSTFQTPYTVTLTPGAWRLLSPTATPATVTAVAENSDVPAIDQYNLEVEHQLPGGVVAELGYVGTRGTRLEEGRNINRAFLASAQNPINGVTTNSTDSPNIQARVPYQGFSPTGVTLIETYGFSSYNSLQATIKRQMSHGIYVQGAYTWSRALTSVTGGDGTNGVFEGGSGNSNDPNNRHDRWGPAGYDRPNRLVIAYIYEIPGWKNGSAFAHIATSGWKLEGTTTFQSGKPITFTDSRNGTAYGNGSAARAQFAPGMSNGNILNHSGTTLSRVKNNTYFNPASTVFALAPVVANGAPNPQSGALAYDYGNSSIGAARGPGNDNWDAAIVKSTRVGGLRKSAVLDFRTEFFNVWNHPEYSNPASAVNATTYSQITSSAGSPRLIQFALKYTF
ncbi:carboxypeptidase regulatory-like domain-containing protein [Granulicella sp. 5B5]|uniref:TonB-dependent receptor n=1 Tax=Granulicella sp. 5B5 TaxID=1617967 RepID=UPI0015F5FC87|nr:carboxypeptidase-like regulatory domain-containing protein [Granulicella sp. 5B5]QMV17966.1 carboxypeptidase regulatory-like domain-containing protein [Granulicella sp. 5B5]